MAARRFNLVTALFISSCAVASDQESIEVNNKLSKCISIVKTEVSRESEIPALSFELEVHKPIAECGCKSALGSYSVYSSNEGYRSYIIGGKIGFLTSSHKQLPLSAERNLINKKELVVEFSCAQPD